MSGWIQAAMQQNNITVLIYIYCAPKPASRARRADILINKIRLKVGALTQQMRKRTNFWLATRYVTPKEKWVSLGPNTVANAHTMG